MKNKKVFGVKHAWVAVVLVGISVFAIAVNKFTVDAVADYSYRAPVQPAAASSAWLRIDLPAKALAQMQSPRGDDVQVLDAQGHMLPSYWGDAGGQCSGSEQAAEQTGPSFDAMPLQHSSSASSKGAAVAINMQGADKSQTQIEIRTGSERNAKGAAPAVVFDLRKADIKIANIVLQAQLPSNQPVDLILYRSTNMRDWYRLEADATLYQFEQAGKDAPQNWKVHLGAPWDARGQFLKISWPPEVQGLRIEKMQALAVAKNAAPVLHDIALDQPQVGKDGHLHWTLPFGTRIERLAVNLNRTGNYYAPVTVSGRSNANTPWRTVAHATLWRSGTGAGVQNYASINMNGVTGLSVRELRIESRDATPLLATEVQAQAQVARQELLAFASGSPPYTLVVGRHVPADERLPARLTAAQLREMQVGEAAWGACWQKLPYVQLDAAKVSANAPAGALAQWWQDLRADPRKLWLWLVLIAGVAVLALAAWGLMRQTQASEQQP